LELTSIDPHWNRHVYLSSSGGTGAKRLYFTSDIEEEILSSDDVCWNLFASKNVYHSMAHWALIPMKAAGTDENVRQAIEYFQSNVLM
jgi:hypothetical protein